MVGMSADNARFIDDVVARGEFPSREAALDQAVSLLRERQRVFDHRDEVWAALPVPIGLFESRGRGVYWIRGHRISLHLLLEFIFVGEQAQQLAARFPTLSGETLQRVLEFVGQHEAVLREYHQAQQACNRLLEREAASSAGADAVRTQFAARRTSA